MMPWPSSCTATGMPSMQQNLQTHAVVALIRPMLLAFSRVMQQADNMPVVHHTAEDKQHRGAVVSGGRAAAGLTPVPVRDSRRAEMRANTFSALSAKGWMMVSRSWYSRKRCVASALCQSLEPKHIKALRLSGRRPL